MSGSFYESVYKLSDLSSRNDQAELVLDIFMVRVLVSVSGKKSIARISQETEISIDQVRESVAKLVEKGLLEPDRDRPKILDRKFFDTLTAVLARVIGPIAPILMVVSTIMCEIILCHIFHKWQVGGNFTYGFRPPVDFHL